MAKLYPPNINGTIPAFCGSEGTTKIVVPFSMNRAVAASEVAGFALKVKTINGDVKGVIQNNIPPLITTSNASVTFTTNMNFTIGQFYKVQLAYIDADGVIGYYSTVAIIKCTSKPTVIIEGLELGKSNVHNYTYTGVYNQKNQDVSEKMYAYRFILKDNQGEIIADSGECLHNTSIDDLPYESHETFTVTRDLDLDQSYYLQFITISSNGLEIASPKYRILQKRSISAEISAALTATLNFNNGYVKLGLFDNIDPIISGTFLISRASSKSGYVWEEIKRFDLHSIQPDRWSYSDCTVEQGVSYKYSLQQYNAQGVYSDRIVSNEVKVDFEDMFLYDGKRQLKIRFNPKVSTYKTDILENKVETIGSKFPFITRNGNVNYKEFNLSGLISYQSDEEEMFMAMTDIGLTGFSSPNDPYGQYKTTNLVDYNIAAERYFKNEVLDWLNNGQVKLFRSPAEGNYIVRLMGVSLSPNDTLSRMLHTFSASAYEIAEFTNSNLSYYGLIDPKENLEVQTRWVTVLIKDAVDKYLADHKLSLEKAIGQQVILNTRTAKSVAFVDMIPGAHVQLDDEDLQIGATGAYSFETNEDSTISIVSYTIDTINEGQLTYGYEAQAVTVFGLINNIELYDVPAEQFIGTEYQKDAKVWNPQYHTYESSINLFDKLNDVRTTVLRVFFLRAEKRPMDTLFIENIDNEEDKAQFLVGMFDDIGDYPCYTDMDCTEPFNWSSADPLATYRIRFKANTNPYNRVRNYKYYVDSNIDEFSELTDVCIDGNTKKIFLYDKSIYDLTINEETINLDEIERYYLPDTGNLTNIAFNDGLIVEVSYSKQIKIYNIETSGYGPEYGQLRSARQEYLNELNTLKTVRAAATQHYDTAAIKTKYRTYEWALHEAIESYKEANGLVE